MYSQMVRIQETTAPVSKVPAFSKYDCEKTAQDYQVDNKLGEILTQYLPN